MKKPNGTRSRKKPIGFKEQLIKHIRKETNETNGLISPSKKNHQFELGRHQCYLWVYASSHIFMCMLVHLCVMGLKKSENVTRAKTDLHSWRLFGELSEQSKMEHPGQKSREVVFQLALDCDYLNEHRRRKTIGKVVKSTNQTSIHITCFPMFSYNCISTEKYSQHLTGRRRKTTEIIKQ